MEYELFSSSRCLGLPNNMHPLSPHSLSQIALKMQGDDGVPIQDRRYRFRKYSKCFVGSDAVEWLTECLKINEIEALRIGQQLINAGYIHHVLDQHSFENSYYFYRFYSDEGRQKCPCCAEVIQQQAKICCHCGCALSPHPNCTVDGATALDELRKSLIHQEFIVFYQPILQLANNVIHGFEALVRWQHPERGLVNPDEFIPLAEEIGFIVELDRWVARQASEQIRQWQQDYHRPDLSLSVNLSAQHFSQPDFVDWVTQILTETGLAPAQFNLEITETSTIQNHRLAQQKLIQIKHLGVQVSADDFGTGYSSLCYLHDFPIDVVKVDRLFVSEISDNKRSLEVVRAVISLAHSLGMVVIAEGIEAPEHVTVLQALQCELGQGYFFAKPMAADRAGTLLGQAGRRCTSQRTQPKNVLS